MAKKKKLSAKPATAKKHAKPAPKPVVPKEPPTMAKKKSAPKSTAVVVRTAPRPTVVVAKAPARKAPAKRRSLLSRLAIAMGAGLVLGVGLYYADRLPWIGPWMHDGDETLADDTMVPIRAAAVYAGLGALATYLTYKVTKDTTATAGPAAITTAMVGMEVFRHFMQPDETEGLGDPQPYGPAGTTAGTASSVTPVYITDQSGVVYSWNGPGTTPQQVQGRIPSVEGRQPNARRPGACDGCNTGRGCDRGGCSVRPASCPTGSPSAPEAPCNVWAGPTAYC